MAARTGIMAPTKRLLTKAEAAAYCGLSPQSFMRVCPVRAINLNPDGQDDSRLLRFDVVQIDAWIDQIANGGSAISLKEKIFREMGI